MGAAVTNIAKGVSVERRTAHGRCPECAGETLARYEVLSEGGWFQVLKCQTCLASLERTPWNRLGYVVRADPSRHQKHALPPAEPA
jgi:hypothetical protein